MQTQIDYISEVNSLPWSKCGKSGGTLVLFGVYAQLHEEPQHWPDIRGGGKQKPWWLLNITYNYVICPPFFQKILSLIDTHLRQRGCGYVHVTACRHRQQWRNVWSAPVALGTISRGQAHPSSRILPPRGLVQQMADRKGLWKCFIKLAWHSSCAFIQHRPFRWGSTSLETLSWWNKFVFDAHFVSLFIIAAKGN